MKLWEKLGDQVGKILDDVFVPEDVRAFLDEGRRAYLSKDYPRAIRCFREANKRRADIPEAHRMLGEALRENGELVEASVVLM